MLPPGFASASLPRGAPFRLSSLLSGMPGRGERSTVHGASGVRPDAPQQARRIAERSE